MIDRNQPPLTHSVHQAHLPAPIRHRLDNNIPLYEIKLGEQNVIKLELAFKAGRWYEYTKLIAKATSQLLKAGTKNKNAEKLAHFFEYFGAKLKIYDGFNRVHIELYCLSKHLETLLPVLLDLVTIPAFDEGELNKFIKRNCQSLKVQLQKNDIVAYRIFTEKLFGENHPYGYNSDPEDYEKISLQQIKWHFNEQYKANYCTMFVAGKTTPAIIEMINKYLGQIPSSCITREHHFPIKTTNERAVIHQTISTDSVQVSIRIGTRTFDRRDSDWNAFYMMNMILGGYFGARLMQNLREDKGYTYGVYSSVETLLHSGYWYVHTDVSHEFKEAALAEIYYEIERLQNELVSEQELKMVQNYTLGMLLTSIDGVFHISSVIKNLVLSGMDHSSFADFAQAINKVTSQDIQLMAQKYLNKEQLLEVVVG